MEFPEIIEKFQILLVKIWLQPMLH
jgi:hypothetical protein